MSDVQAAERKSLEFFSMEEELQPTGKGKAGQKSRVNGLNEEDLELYMRGSALTVDHLKNAAISFDDCEMHIGVFEFAAGLPMPLHSHSADCIYYVERGSIIMGSRTIGPGEGFLVRANQPYGFSTGPDGLRMMEFTNTRKHDIKILEKNVAAWNKRVERAVEKLK